MTHPTDDDLIRRGDAIAALDSVALTYGATWEPHSVRLCKDALRAIPAAQPSPDVAALVEALTIAANRLQRLAVEFDAGTRMFFEVSEWADETRTALARVKGGE